MKRILLLVAVLGLVLPLGSGCIVHTHPKHSSARKASKSCKPSQYWDGKQCRHKGKGKGARKHDGR